MINTLLNVAYFEIAHGVLFELTGSRLPMLHNVHHGDDVWLRCTYSSLCAFLFYVSNLVGAVMQKIKIMCGPQRGEYLRVLYANGTAKGYLQRRINIEGSAITDLHGWTMASELSTSITAIVRRGLHPAMADVTAGIEEQNFSNSMFFLIENN